MGKGTAKKSKLFSTYLVRSYYIVLKKSCLNYENQAEKSKIRLDKVKDGTINLNGFLGWLAKGEIGVCTTPKRIKTEEVEEEFKEKNEYIINAPQLDKLDLVEITQSEFIEYVFERDTKLENEVKPFEDERSPEYILWLAQKRKKVEKIDYSSYLCWRYNPIVFIKQGKANKHRIC